jgi:tetratricopeptide (TPR) repeat protein
MGCESSSPEWRLLKKGTSFYTLLSLSVGLLLLIWQIHDALLPSLARNLVNIGKMPALQAADSFFLSGNWPPCQASVALSSLDQGGECLPLGMLSQLDCPAALGQVSRMESLEGLSDVEVFWFGYALVRDGQRQAAIEVWRQYPPISSYLVNMARMNHSNLETVENLTGLAVAISPDNWMLWRDRGLLLQTAKPEVAAQAFQQVMELAPENPDGYLRLGELRQTQGYYSEAVTLCGRATELASSEPYSDLQARLCLGRSAFYSQDLDYAEQTFLSILAWKPDNANSLLWLGRVYRSQGRFELAGQYLRHAIEVAQEQGLTKLEGNAWYDLGYALKDQGKWAEAVVAFRQMLTLLPDAPSADHVRTLLDDLEAKLAESK